MEKIKEILKNKYLNIMNFIVLSIFIVGCVQDSSIVMNDSEFNEIIDKYCEQNDCVEGCSISFKDLFTFNWDYLYIIGGEYNPGVTNKDLVSKLIGVEYSGKKNDILGRSLIFIEKKKIVFEIYSAYDDSNWDNEEYYITFVKGTTLKKYFTRSNAEFRIEKKALSRGEGYILSPIVW